jgi:tRNA(Ile)-lysidine synthase
MLCQRLEVPLEVGKADVAAIAKRQGDGLEAAARAARYDFLLRTAEKLGARFVAVAHTADDQIETVLHRILRGTGIDGLRGIPAVRPLSPSVSLVRPLLGVRRVDVLDYLTRIGQDYRTDLSNADLRWTRNRLRHKLLPAMRKYYRGDIDAALLRLSSQAGESQRIIAETARQLAPDCVQHEPSGPQLSGSARTCRIRIHCRPLADQTALIVREVCKAAWQDAGWPQQAMGYDQWQQLAVLIGGNFPPSSLNLPGNVRALLADGDLVLERGGLP